MKTRELVLTLDQLRPDEENPISCTLDPAFLDLDPQDEAQPVRVVEVEGSCTLVDEVVLLDLLVKAYFSVRCALCNEPFEYEVCLDRFRHQELIENIDRKRWDLSEIIRESIVIELPFFPQCGGKECLHVDEIRKYFHDRTQEREEEKNFPFQNIFDR